jgi:uncharacterized membrane protein
MSAVYPTDPNLEPHSTADETEPAGFGLERLVFFSDAVFAIAMTLLVIDVRLPELGGQISDGELADALGELWPRIFAYALSFAVIGGYWLAHWRRYLMVQKTNEGLARLNLLLLGLVAFIPFPTSLLGQYGDRPLTVAFYAVVLALAGLAGAACWAYSDRRGLLRSTVTRAEYRASLLRALAAPAVFLASLLALPVVGTTATELLWPLVFPAQWLAGWWVRRSSRPAEPDV